MDCEGAEHDIFDESANAWLKRVKRISMEYHEDPSGGLGDIEALLRKNGFEVCRFDNHRIYARRLE